MKAETTLDLFPDDRLERDGPTLRLERKCWNRGYSLVAGVDEAGRGCLSGPVVAAAVILPIECRIEGVTDSKQLRPAARRRLAETIREQALAVETGWCTPAEIDSLNILRAALEAMRRAVDALSPAADFILIDGNISYPNPGVPAQTLIKGDSRCHAIAAASIIAKTTRDAYMMRLHDEYPGYAWNSNMGYGTKEHYAALAVLGPSPHHRLSFRLS